jgi:hypothetical protein
MELTVSWADEVVVTDVEVGLRMFADAELKLKLPEPTRMQNATRSREQAMEWPRERC